MVLLYEVLKKTILWGGGGEFREQIFTKTTCLKIQMPFIGVRGGLIFVKKCGPFLRLPSLIQPGI